MGSTTRFLTTAYSIVLDESRILYHPQDDVTVSVVSTDSTSAVISVTLSDLYSSYVYTVYLDGVVVLPDKDGNYTLAPSSEIGTLTFELTYSFDVSVADGDYTVIMSGEEASDSYTVGNGSTAYFRLVPDEGYSIENATVYANGVECTMYGGGWFSITATADIELTVEGIEPMSYEITLIADGSAETVTVAHGSSLDTVLEDDWYLIDSDEPYDLTMAVYEGITLYSEPVPEDERALVDYGAARGTITATVDDDSYVLIGTEVTFTYDGGNSYEVKGWYVNGEYTESSDTSITVTIEGNTSVTLAVTYFQSGYEYIVDAPMPISDEDVESILWIGEYNDPLQPSYYENMPDGYVSVGDYLFYSNGNTIYRIDLNSDFSDGVGTRTSVNLESTAGSLYYVSGYVITNYGTILNTNLEVVGNTGLSGTIRDYNGDIIVFGSNRYNRLSLVEGEDGSVSCETIWTCVVSMKYGYDVIYDGYLYFMPISTNIDNRAISSIDLESGRIVDTVSLDDYIYGHYLDDGWLTVYDGWVYIASYTRGLFGESNSSVVDSTPKLIRVAVEDGEFIDGSLQWVAIPNSHDTGFIVYRDRGYMQVSSTLYVFDLTDFSIIYTVGGAFTHGGMVLNTYYACEENDWTVYIYVVPYSNSQNVIVYKDCVGQTEGEVIELTDIGYIQYATTHIQTSASGYIYYYNDSSIFFIAGESTHEVEFVVDGSVVHSQKLENGTSIVLPTAPTKDGFEFAGWVNYDGTPVTEGSVVNGAMRIMALWTAADVTEDEPGTDDAVAGTVSEDDGRTVVDVDVRYDGDADEPYLLLIAEYGDRCVWVYSPVTIADGEAAARFLLTAEGLERVSVTLVDGTSSADIDGLGRWSAELA